MVKVSIWTLLDSRSCPRCDLKDRICQRTELVFCGGSCTTVATAYLTDPWGDGPRIFWLFDRRCLTDAQACDGTAITVPKSGTNVRAMEDEFFATMSDRTAYK